MVQVSIAETESLEFHQHILLSQVDLEPIQMEITLSVSKESDGSQILTTPLELYCDANPNALECRVYDD